MLAKRQGGGRATLLAAALAVCAPALAQYPRLSGEASLEMQSEWGVRNDDPETERGDSELNLEAELELEFGRHLSIEGTALLEPVRDSELPGNGWFEHEALFVEELLLKYENGPFEAWTGKFGPDYRDSRDQERGIWTEEFSREYEIVEKIGAGLGYSLRTRGAGNHSLSVAAFANDTSALAERYGARPEDARCEGDADLSSWSALLEGHRAGGKGGPYYQLGYRHLDACEADERDEAGVLATLGHVLQFAPGAHVQSDLLAEVGLVADFEGSSDDHWYYSISSISTYDRHWQLLLGATVRVIAVDGRSDALDHVFQATAAYRSGKGLRIEAGWLNMEEFGLRNNTLGFVFRYRSRF